MTLSVAMSRLSLANGGVIMYDSSLSASLSALLSASLSASLSESICMGA